MNNLECNIKSYLEFCEKQKRLDEKTIKAYKIDLKQFADNIMANSIDELNTNALETYISSLHTINKPKTTKRKIASIKAFFHYLEYRNLISVNPFNKIQIKFREPVILPKIIPINIVEQFLTVIYKEMHYANTEYKRRNALRDAAVAELLFSTGIRISELCSLKTNNIDLNNGTILIYGKGDKERRIQIGNKQVIDTLKKYKHSFEAEIRLCNYFFANQSGRVLNDQAVRRMINKYTKLAAIDLHITPHMFRHTFATSLLEADVDIRYIQEMLGHSSINVTEIYTHVATAKQREILLNKHPRKNFQLNI